MVYDLIYIKQLCEPVKMALCLKDYIMRQITQICNAQMHLQSTVQILCVILCQFPSLFKVYHVLFPF